MKKNFTLAFILLFCFTLYSQVGVHTANPQGSFHVDAAGNNPTDGTAPNNTQQLDDFVISKTGVVSIGTTTPSPYSALEIESNKGLRLPQLTTSQISNLDAISSNNMDKKNGLVLYNTATNCINYWANVEWLELCKCNSVSGTPIISNPSPSLKVGTLSFFTVSGVSNATSYQWKVNGIIQTGQNGNSFSYVPSDTNPFYISVVAYGCNNSFSTEANSGSLAAIANCTPVSGTPIISNPSPSLKVGTLSFFTVSGVSNATSYQWKVNGIIQTGQNGNTFSYIPSDTNPFYISVVAYGCNNSFSTEANSGSLTAIANCTPVSGSLDISPKNLSLSTGTIQRFTASGVSNATSYEWRLNGVVVQNTPSNFYDLNYPTYFIEGYYTITVTAHGGCNSSLSTTTNFNLTFKCTQAGRFFKAGTNCKIYNFCTDMNNGTFVQQTYTCPSTSTFDPINRYCSTTPSHCPF